MQIGSWRGQDNERLSDEILKVLGADDYLSRFYYTEKGMAGLYVGYYKSQRQGDTMHSPLNCLPGAGWQPLEKSYLPIQVAYGNGDQTEITVNRYVIEKGLDQQVVLYWYQSHGRVIANEYRSKIFMVYDAARLNRSDAALVRVTSPKLGSDAGGLQEAEARAVQFVKEAFPLMERFLPSVAASANPDVFHLNHVDLGAYRQSENERLRKDDLLRLLPRTGGLVLEVGSRDGYHSKILAQRFSLVVAIDLEPQPIAASRVVISKASVTALPFQDSAFDCVLCAEVLEHVPDVGVGGGGNQPRRPSRRSHWRAISSGYSRRQAHMPQLRQSESALRSHQHL